MLHNCDTFPFHLVCFIRAQEIYTYFESFVRGMLLIPQRKALKNSMSKSELPVKHSFDRCVCMKHIYETPGYTLLDPNASCLIQCVELNCSCLVSNLLYFLSIPFSHRHLFSQWTLFKCCSEDRILALTFQPFIRSFISYFAVITFPLYHILQV